MLYVRRSCVFVHVFVCTALQHQYAHPMGSACTSKYLSLRYGWHTHSILLANTFMRTQILSLFLYLSSSLFRSLSLSLTHTYTHTHRCRACTSKYSTQYYWCAEESKIESSRCNYCYLVGTSLCCERQNTYHTPPPPAGQIYF